ncbi:hypothetical protein ACFYKT_20565 [Cytobacillus sp. FJAT-53684]|uniref:Uncharacterized protein n=1 Tax=Cytobacillus mangrovibacter TaxID=3299024 RepID=A0ABW6K5W0_9BACI
MATDTESVVIYFGYATADCCFLISPKRLVEWSEQPRVEINFYPIILKAAKFAKRSLF